MLGGAARRPRGADAGRARRQADRGGAEFAGRRCALRPQLGLRGRLPFLHFELCYYQAIDFAIAQGLRRVEAGAQGEHKIQRGYLPQPTYSAHWIGIPAYGARSRSFWRRSGRGWWRRWKRWGRIALIRRLGRLGRKAEPICLETAVAAARRNAAPGWSHREVRTEMLEKIVELDAKIAALASK